MSYLIIGKKGQLAFACSEYWPEARAYTSSELDISDKGRVYAVITEIQPSVVINTGAYTDVEKAEEEYETNFAVNAIGPAILAKATKNVGAILVHVSTDYVFDGNTDEGFYEGDCPCPINAYGIAKYAGERAVLAYNERSYVLRTSALFGPRLEDAGDNFVTKRLMQMRRGDAITMVHDQWTVPTCTKDLAYCIKTLLEKGAPFGIYHGVNDGGAVTWFEFTKAIASIAQTNTNITPISTGASGTNVQRPKRSVLIDTKLKHLGVVVPDWRVSLSQYLTQMK